MKMSRKLLLLAAVFAVQAAAPVQARAEACHEFAIAGADQPILLRNSNARPVTLALRFEAADISLSCGVLTVAAGSDTGTRTLASLCPAAAATASGTLHACAAPVVVRAPRGAPTGDLLADLQAHNLDAAGR